MNTNIISIRMDRQHLTRQANEEEYIQLYRDLSPGQNVYWHGFGQPPVLSFRSGFDDIEYNRQRLAEGQQSDLQQGDRQHTAGRLVKGRFQGGNLGWIDICDLELFACMCKKPLENPSVEQLQILDIIHRNGCMSIQQIKQKTGMLVKKITPILHRLQEAFLIFENQINGEFDRSFHIFSSYFPNIDLTKYTRPEALKICLPRLLYRLVWADIEGLKDFYRFTAKEIKAVADELVEDGVFCEFENGYILKADEEIVKNGKLDTPQNLYILHRNDVLIKTQESRLKAIYKNSDWDILQYILINGEVHGAVLGKFKLGPYIIENIEVDYEYIDLRPQIISAVQFENPNSEIHRFCYEEVY